jgi:hypothetical protein
MADVGPGGGAAGRAGLSGMVRDLWRKTVSNNDV